MTDADRRKTDERLALERLRMLQMVVSKKVSDAYVGAADRVVDPDWVGFSLPAHEWAVAMIEVAKEQRRRALADANASHALGTDLGEDEKRKAYVEGFEAWFASGRINPDQAATSNRSRVLLELHAFTRGAGGVSSRTQRAVSAHDVQEQARKTFLHWPIVRARKEAARALAAPAGGSFATPAAAAQPQQRRPSSTSRPRPSAAASSSASPVLVSPVAAAAAAAGAEQAQQAVPSEPLSPVERYAAFPSFLVEPGQWHTFDAGASLRDQIRDAMQRNRMFAVVPRPGSDGPPEFQLLDTTCAEFGAFAGAAQLSALLKSDESFRQPQNPALWPPGFGQLPLDFLGKGSYNSIWQPKPGVDYSGLPLPPQTIRALAAGDAVFRTPLPRGPLRGYVSSDAIITEMVNLASAAKHGYGLLLYGVAWTRAADDGNAPLYRLYCFMQRGKMDVDKRLALINERAPNHPQNPMPYYKQHHHLFDCLLRTVWGYSTDRCVFVDAKPGNFVDVFPDRITAEARGAVRVIDLAGDGFKRMRTSGVDAEARTRSQGWRLIWLHNVLVISCNIRMQLPYEAYVELWWKKIRHAVFHLLRVELRQHDAFEADLEYQQLRVFLQTCKWYRGPDSREGLWDPNAGQFRPPSVAPTVLSAEPAEVAHECRRYAIYYFYDIWLEPMALRYANPVLRQCHFRGDPAAEAGRREAERYFDTSLRPKVIPMCRHFGEQLRPGPQHAPLLVEVMFAYCDVEKDELQRRYLRGESAAPGMRRWPPAQFSHDHRSNCYAKDLRYWRYAFGFEYER